LLQPRIKIGLTSYTKELSLSTIPEILQEIRVFILETAIDQEID